MKHLILTSTFIFCFSIFCLAQMTKQEEATFPIPSGKKIEANLKFARHIDIKSWNRQEIGLKKTIKYSKEELLQIDQQKAEEKNGVLVIETDYQKTEGIWKKYQCWNCDSDSGSDRECICFQISYELMLPAGMNLEVETISGDIKIGAYNGGEIDLESISGGIEIRDYTGAIRAKSISGFVDFTSTGRRGFDVASKSVTGEIYTDYDIKLDEGSTAWSKRLNRSLNGGGEKVVLETVSGDIYLRKGN